MSNVTGSFDDHMTAHYDVTVPQLSLALAALASTAVYAVRMFTTHFLRSGGGAIVSVSEHRKSETEKLTETKVELDVKDEDVKKNFTKVIAPPCLNEFLSNIIQFAIILIMFWMSDYRKGFPVGERVYNEDTFLFLVFILFLVGIYFTTKQTPDVILNRDQTEEWKGWMQVMFVWYHYFHAFTWYNWIRVYIAAYVWMTGFGNFSFFWLKKDYSFWRIFKMLFRLNFFVLALCATLHNEYVLYYICAMHTYWFLSVYATMAILPAMNYDPHMMVVKFAVYALVNFLLFDVANVAEMVFEPLSPILGYTTENQSIMHEWVFRSGLDHWACFIGMLCAYNYPHYESFLRSIENKANLHHRYIEHAVKVDVEPILPIALFAGTVLIVLLIWYDNCMNLGKFEYNAIHPYTSCIPVIGFVILRNLYPALRTRYVLMFNWLGKITLETYLTQLHLYLQSNAKQLIVYIPKYPLLNFSLATIVYLLVSHRVFNITVCFSAFLIPHDVSAMKRNMFGFVLLLAASTVTAYVVKILY